MISLSKTLALFSVAAGVLVMPPAASVSSAQTPAKTSASASGSQAAPGAGKAFVIAHRGASAYAPEHTAEAYTLAIAQGADYVEPDLGITKDGVLVCTHDTFLERTTNVRELFPDRFTEMPGRDGKPAKRWLVESLTLAELKTLDAGSWFDPKFKGARMLTFQEAIDLVKGKAGLFPEIKEPKRFRAKGFDPEQLVTDILKKNDLVNATFKGRPAVHMQVFEEESLRKLATLLPDVPRSFLMGSPDMVQKWLSPENVADLKTFATGIAPAYQIIDRMPDIVTKAHAAGLTVVPYTFAVRPKTNPYPDAPPEWKKIIEESLMSLPATPDAARAAMKKFVEVYKVDGMFTDNPDLFPR